REGSRKGGVCEGEAWAPKKRDRMSLSIPTTSKFSAWNFLDVSEPIKPADPVTIAILISSSCELSHGIADSPSPAEEQACLIAFVLFRSLVHDLIEKTVQGFCNSGRPIRLLCCFYCFTVVPSALYYPFQGRRDRLRGVVRHVGDSSLDFRLQCAHWGRDNVSSGSKVLDDLERKDITRGLANVVRVNPYLCFAQKAGIILPVKQPVKYDAFTASSHLLQCRPEFTVTCNVEFPVRQTQLSPSCY